MVPLTKMEFSGENIKSKHNEHVCDQCNKSFKVKDSLRRHKKIECGKEKSFKCSICHLKFYYEFMLNSHMKKNHQNNVKMEYRNKEIIIDTKNSDGKEIQRNQTAFPCNKCGKSFKLQDVLNKHQQKNKCGSMENIFKCPMCDKRFYDEHFLNG